MAISMLKIRRPLGRLIFNMGIAIPGKTVFLIETAPWSRIHPADFVIINGIVFRTIPLYGILDFTIRTSGKRNDYKISDWITIMIISLCEWCILRLNAGEVERQWRSYAKRMDIYNGNFSVKDDHKWTKILEIWLHVEPDLFQDT